MKPEVAARVPQKYADKFSRCRRFDGRSAARGGGEWERGRRGDDLGTTWGQGGQGRQRRQRDNSFSPPSPLPPFPTPHSQSRNNWTFAGIESGKIVTGSAFDVGDR
jgi:hypothetical protein